MRPSEAASLSLAVICHSHLAWYGAAWNQGVKKWLGFGLGAGGSVPIVPYMECLVTEPFM